jgi:hypothetical protein
MSLYSRVSPLRNVLDGDSEAAKLFDIFSALGIKTAGGAFRREEGETHVDYLSPRDAKGRRIPSAVLAEIVEAIDFDKVIADGLEKSLAHVWDEDLEIVGHVWVDVEARCIQLTELRTLVSLDALFGVKIVL